MKTIRDWNDLGQFGIKILTGEACRYGMRYLCDVDAGGSNIIREFLGIPYGVKLGTNWNSGSVGSVMLPFDVFRQLAAFCLLHDGALAVTVIEQKGVIGCYNGDDSGQWNEMIITAHNMKTLVRTYNPIGGPGVGSRMTHAMSGRVE